MVWAEAERRRRSNLDLAIGLACGEHQPFWAEAVLGAPNAGSVCFAEVSK
jgi:hypothetical protein